MSFGGPGSRRSFWAGRRLSLELLERRDLLAVLRIVDWNAENRPNDAASDADFSTVLQAIGNETIQGNTKRIDILALQETDTAAGGNSIGRIETVLDALYPSTNYASFVSSLDGGGDATAFIYDTASVSLVVDPIEVSASLTHTILRGQFRPAGTTGASDFFLYTVHLKSGDTGADATLRGSEAAILRNDADSLLEGAHVLMVGDFNWKTSSEVAYANLTAGGAGQLQDVANAPGDWFDDPDFKIFHSQDPGGAMDDRFDMQLASGEFFNGLGLEYIANSFHVFGNNGTHTFDSTIDTGTGASPTVLAALIAASDHLPVVADYQLIGTVPFVLITQSGGNTTVTEGASPDSYQINLQTVPSDDVQVTVDPDGQTDLGAGAGAPIVLTFTPANALIPQTVTVTAVDDLTVEGTHSSVISHTAVSADSGYNGISIANVVAGIVDNDNPSVVITELMYEPQSDETPPGVAEWIEIVNAGTGAVILDGWTFDDEDGTNWGAIPAGTVLNPNQIAVFFDSAFTSAATFRSEWSVPASALVVGVSWGALANSPGADDEKLELRNSVEATIDLVDYDESSPWPSGADGPSIYLKGLSLDNNNGPNWARSVVNQASAVSPSGPTFSVSDVGSPGRLFLPGDYNTNGVVDTADYILWRQLLGTSDPRADGSGSTTGVPDGVVDQFDYAFWRSNFGNIGVPPAGSGGGAGEDAVASFSSEPVAVQTTTEPTAFRNASAVDAALFDLVSTTAARSPRRTLNVDSLSGEPQAMVRANLLLVLNGASEPATSIETFDFTAEAREGDQSAAVDDCLELLGVEALFHGLRVPMAL